MSRGIRGFPSPLWGGVRGGGNHNGRCSAIPPSLALPHKGGGNATGFPSPLWGGVRGGGTPAADVLRSPPPSPSPAPAPKAHERALLALAPAGPGGRGIRGSPWVRVRPMPDKSQSSPFARPASYVGLVVYSFLISNGIAQGSLNRGFHS